MPVRMKLLAQISKELLTVSPKIFPKIFLPNRSMVQEMLQKKLQNGKSTNFQVLQLQDKLTQARATEIGALTVYNKALHDFYFSEGTTLQRAKIELESK